jgi:hypothetical protein
MVRFGNSTVHGRRAMPRTDAPLLAVLSKGNAEHTAELINLSRTGARLKGSGFPEEGEELIFRAEKVQAACSVVWLDGDQCAVEFDTPIAAAEVKRVRALARFVEAVANPRDGLA